MHKNHAAEYFPKNYIESRSRFLADAKALGADCSLGRWVIPSRIDPDLTVDYAWLPQTKDPKNLVVLISGIHGSETYTASAVLHLFMQEILPGIDRRHTGVLVVHAMNPYGFKYHQRCTENHVNLNRNFSVTGEIFKKKNQASSEMHDLFHTAGPVTDSNSKLIHMMKKVADKIFFNDDISVDQLTKSIAPGQFEKPEFLEYGGKQTEPQTKALIDLVGRLMPKYENVIGLDIHTGLGDRGRLHLLTDGYGQTLNPELLKQILHTEEDKEFYVLTPPEAEGFYEVDGSTNIMFGDLALAGQRVCALTLEFGTLGHTLEQQVQDWNSFMTEHQGHIYGYASEELKKLVRDRNFERSYPNSDSWREAVLEAAEGTLRRIFARI